MSDCVITKEQIAQKIQELAQILAKKYQGKEVLLVGILKGAYLLTADVSRALHEAGCNTFEVSFIILKSYHTSTTVSKEITLVTDIDVDPTGRHIILIDDIFDTGKSFDFVRKHLLRKKAASVEGFTLLAKPDRHTVLYRPRYVCFTVPNVWVEGYGMDSAEKGRGNPDIIAKHK